MPDLRFRVVLKTTQQELRRQILEQVSERLNDIFRNNKNEIREVIKNHVHAFFQFTPTYESLTSGLLVGHFGFPKGTENSRVNKVLEAIANSTEVIVNRVQPVGTKLTGGLAIFIGSKEYSRYLSLPEATVTYINKKGKPVKLPWLDWLLLRGDKILVEDYRIVFGQSVSEYSRSGLAIMVEDPTEDNHLGWYWRVPPEFSGTKDNNWLTRTLKQFRDQLFQAIMNDIRTILEREF